MLEIYSLITKMTLCAFGIEDMGGGNRGTKPSRLGPNIRKLNHGYSISKDSSFFPFAISSFETLSLLSIAVAVIFLFLV